MTNGTVISSSGRVSSVDLPPFNKNLAIAILIVHVAEILVGFPKNLQICLSLYKRKDLCKIPHVLLGNLSLIGALVSGIYVPLHLVINVMDQFIRKPLHGEFCVARHSSSLLFLGLQTLTLVAMATDRHDSVVRPYKRRITIINVRKVVKGIWLTAGLITATHLVLATNDDVNNCNVNLQRKAASLVYTLAFANAYIFGTAVTIFTTFVRIVKKLRSSPFAESNQNSEIQVTRFSYMVLFFFIISWIPLSSYSIVTLLLGFTSPEARGVKALMLAISNLSYVVNPFIHKNILRAAQKADVSAKSRNDQEQVQRKRPENARIEEEPEINEMQLDSGATQP